MNEPWMKFFTGDYFRDPGVRSVSLAARGLWMDMLCLMHQSARKGYLQHPSSLPISPVQLARMAGGAVDEVAGLLQELEDSGVFSRTKDGVIYSRRMDRDARKSALCSEAGRRGGGNPHVKGPPLSVTLKGEPKGRLKVISPSESESEKDIEANASIKNKGRGTREEILAYVTGPGGLPESDGEWFFDKMLASGWKNAGQPVKDWRATIRTWKANSIFPSQKLHHTPKLNGNHRTQPRPALVPGAPW